MLITQTIVATATAFVLQITKALGINIKTNLLPLISVLVGVIGNFLFVLISEDGFLGADIINVIFGGVMAGLMASGGYDTVKTIKKMGKIE